MSVPTLTGPTQITNANSLTNWSGWGSNTTKWGVSTDIKIEGTGSNGLGPSSTGDSGWGYTSVGGINATTNLIMIWVNVVSPAFVNTMDNKGIYIRICSGASWTTEYSDYYMGGNDVGWCGRGWHLLVLDANRTADATNGSTTKTSIARIGVGFNVTATASKSDVILIDAMYYGTTMEVTGPSLKDATNGIDLNDNGGSADTIVRQDAGSFITAGFVAGDYVKVAEATTSGNNGVYLITVVTASTLTIPTGSLASTTNNDVTVRVMASVTMNDIYTKDGPTDGLWKGVVSPEAQGAWIVNYPLVIGDVSGANSTFFLSRNDLIILGDQALSTTSQTYISLAQDTGKTHVLFGSSSGTGDTRVGYGGSVIVGEGTDFDYGTGTTSRTTKSPRKINFTTGIASCEVYGSSFINLDGGMTFYVTGTSHYITNDSFQICGQIDLGGVETRNITITGYTGTAGAMLWRNGVTNIENSYFLANRNTAGTAQAIEHTVASTGEAYTGLQFANNNYDIHFSALTGNLVINATKGLFESNPSTYDNDSSGTVTINNTKTLEITVVDKDQNPIYLAQVAIYKTSDSTELMNEDTDILGVASVSDFNYSVDTAIYYRVRKSTSGTRYYPFSSTGTIKDTGFSATVILTADPSAP